MSLTGASVGVYYQQLDFLIDNETVCCLFLKYKQGSWKKIEHTAFVIIHYIIYNVKQCTKYIDRINHMFVQCYDIEDALLCIDTYPIIHFTW